LSKITELFSASLSKKVTPKCLAAFIKANSSGDEALYEI
jgi:hypothetical protein